MSGYSNPIRVSQSRLGAILDQVSERTMFAPSVLRGPSRRRDITTARQEFMWEARRQTGASYPQIGDFLRRDHTTVIYGERQHAARMCGESVD